MAFYPSPLLNSSHAPSQFFKELLHELKKKTSSFPNSSPTLTDFKFSHFHNPSPRLLPTSPVPTKASIRLFSSLPTKNVKLTHPHPSHHPIFHHALPLILITSPPTTKSSLTLLTHPPPQITLIPKHLLQNHQSLQHLTTDDIKHCVCQDHDIIPLALHFRAAYVDDDKQLLE